MIKVLISTLLLFTTSIYNVNFTSIDDTQIAMGSFKGKKILLVNIATGSARVHQLGELQQLQSQYKEQLVVIGFPSNSFGKEPRNNNEIKAFCKNNYGVSFLLAQKAAVKGAGLQAVYKWLTKKSENGVLEDDIKSDFQKYLLDGEGNLIGIFAPSVSPLSMEVQNAIAR